MNKIENLDELRNRLVFRFSTRPLIGLRVVRVEGTLVAVGGDHRIYSTAVSSTTPRRVDDLHTVNQLRLIEGMGRLGLLGSGVGEALRAEANAEDRKRQARYVLDEAERAAALGVPFTKSQLRRLRAAAGAEP